MKSLLGLVAQIGDAVVPIVLPLVRVVAPGVVALVVVLASHVALAQPPDPFDKYHRRERRVCVHPPNVPKHFYKWAMYPNGKLATHIPGEFYAAVPPDALIYIYDPNAPWCKYGQPEPPVNASEPSGTPLAPPSNGGNGEKEGRNQAGSDAKKKAAERAAKAVEEAKVQAEKEAQGKKEKARKAAEEAAERKRKEAEAKNEADEAARKARAQQEAEEQFRQRNSSEARWARGEAVLPPASQHTLPPASQHRLASGAEYQLPNTCEPMDGRKIAPLRSIAANCAQGMFDDELSSGEQVALPTACTPPPEGGVTPIRSLGEECTKGKPTSQAMNKDEEPKEVKEDSDPSTLEGLARELAYAAAMTSGQFNEETAKNGDPFGILGGKNIGGSANPYTQIAAAVGIILANAAPSPAQCREVLKTALRSSERTILTTTSEAMEKAAEQLVKKYGGKRMAAALEQAGMIAPYRLMRKFTERLGGLYQAHHILEVAKFREFFRGMDPDLGPAVILSAAEHARITADLAAATASAKTKQALLAAYKKAYKDYPHWVEAIKSYFTK